jgi:hypothetical protein
MQWANGAAETHWLDLLESRLRQRATTTVTRAAKKQDEIAFARKIAKLPRQEWFAKWHSMTGKSEKALYRRMSEVSILDSQKAGE